MKKTDEVETKRRTKICKTNSIPTSYLLSHISLRSRTYHKLQSAGTFETTKYHVSGTNAVTEDATLTRLDERTGEHSCGVRRLITASHLLVKKEFHRRAQMTMATHDVLHSWQFFMTSLTRNNLAILVSSLSSMMIL
jgi:hypothetical protein